MLPEVTLPASLAVLLGALRPCFTAPSYRTFCGLAAGLAGQVRRRPRPGPGPAGRPAAGPGRRPADRGRGRLAVPPVRPHGARRGLAVRRVLPLAEQRVVRDLLRHRPGSWCTCRSAPARSLPAGAGPPRPARQEGQARRPGAREGRSPARHQSSRRGGTGHPAGRRVPRSRRPRGGRRRLSRPRAEAAARRRDLDHPAARQRRPVRPGPAPAARRTGPALPQGPPAGHPRRAGRRRHLDTGDRADVRPQPPHRPGRHHLPVVRLPAHPHRPRHPGPQPRRRAGPGHYRPGHTPPPPSSPGTPPVGPSSRPSPTPATSSAPARLATAPAAPSCAPSPSPCSCTP
jgi:hypothetical protein